MKILLLLLLSITTFSSSAMEVVINCTKLDGGGSCRVRNGQARFLSINGNSILSKESPTHCSDRSCDVVGSADPNFLKVGSNRIDFKVATFTSDLGLYVYHRYKFFFAGNYKAQFYSKRTGSNADQTRFSIRLDLQEIDPALYREYERARAALSRADKTYVLDRQWKEWKEELSKIEAELSELQASLAVLNGLDLSDINPVLLEKLGIAKNQFLLLTARQDELQQFIEDGQSNAKKEEEEAIARYQAVRAKAKKYQAELADLPLPPKLSNDFSVKISPLVESMVDDLNLTLASFEKALRDQDVAALRSSLKKWKTLSDYVVSSYLTVEQSEFNNTEKNLLYRTVSDGTRTIFKNGFTDDLWMNTNDLSSETRKTIDELAFSTPEAQKLRETLYFKKIPEALKNDVQLTLNRATQLNEKLKLLEDKNEKEVNVKKIAQSSLRVALSTLDESINNNDEEALNESKDSISLGLQVIDVALSVTPVVSSARDIYELFTGKNMVTGEKFEAIDYSLAFVGIFTGLAGGNLAKIAFERSKKLVQKISSTSGLTKVPEISLQVENMILHARKWFYRKTIARDAKKVNEILRKKYSRFTEPPFTLETKVLHRFSSAGEEYCRVFSRFTRDGVLDSNKVNKQGGIFVFRCADLINKSVKEIMDFLAIPEPPAGSTSYITKFVLPSGVSLFEGKANPLFGKVGQGMQILIDTQSKVLLEALENSDDQLLKGVFRGI